MNEALRAKLETKAAEILGYFAQEKYRGWRIYEGPTHPVTGRWRAARHGVTIGAHSKAALHRMIDLRG